MTEGLDRRRSALQSASGLGTLHQSAYAPMGSHSHQKSAATNGTIDYPPRTHNATAMQCLHQKSGSGIGQDLVRNKAGGNGTSASLAAKSQSLVPPYAPVS